MLLHMRGWEHQPSAVYILAVTWRVGRAQAGEGRRQGESGFRCYWTRIKPQHTERPTAPSLLLFLSWEVSQGDLETEIVPLSPEVPPPVYTGVVIPDK